MTGALGFIGRHLAEALLGEGADVTILDNAEGEPSSGAHLLRGDVRNPDDVARAVVFLASELAAFVTGVLLPVDGGILVAPLEGYVSAAESVA